jgi:hypothetical protein
MGLFLYLIYRYLEGVMVSEDAYIIGTEMLSTSKSPLTHVKRRQMYKTNDKHNTFHD